MNGLLNINKPKGMTSADVVHRVRRITGEKRVGHMGTLDPQGTGVLLLGVGRGAKLFDAFLSKDKVYEADFTFGFTTDTLDGEGIVTDRTSVLPSRVQLEKALPGLTGRLNQVPPRYSAKSVGGVRAYKLAREDRAFELSAAAVAVYEFSLLEERTADTWRFLIRCSSGTYVRSLCRDLAASVGSLAAMTAINRLRAGSFSVSDSVGLDALAADCRRYLIPLTEAVAAFPRYDAPAEKYELLKNGVKLYTDAVIPASAAVYCRGELFGLGHTDAGRLVLTTRLHEAG
ncbi:MAG: tRNA pseudouridine(55) synthase TruB [Clostridiales bacterium]|nr:tRNA pseudouridine(55) synthase TruB [Clostridiales bacterium]